LHAVFLDRVIARDAVQRHRGAVREEYVEHFFAAGRRPSLWGDDLWPLDEWPTPPAEDLTNYGGPPAWSPALQAAWAAAEQPWRAFVAALRSGTLVATGRHAASGVRGVIDSIEFARTGLVLDVRNGDLLDNKRRPLWSSLLVVQTGQAPAAMTAAHESTRGERSEKKEEKARICREMAATLIDETPALENIPTTLARRVEQRCLHKLQQLGHKKTKYTVGRYLLRRK
jgi:hypothetical protein